MTAHIDDNGIGSTMRTAQRMERGALTRSIHQSTFLSAVVCHSSAVGGIAREINEMGKARKRVMGERGKGEKSKRAVES